MTSHQQLKTSLVLALLTILFFCEQMSLAKQKTLLVIHSYPKESPWTQGINEGLKDTFRKQQLDVSIDIEYFYVDELMRKGHSILQKEKNRLLKKISAKRNKIDGILICDDEATDQIISELSKTNQPVFFTGINQSQSSLNWKRNLSSKKITGVFETYPVLKTLELLKRLKPSVSRISILSSNSTSSQLAAKLIEDEMKNNPEAKTSGVELKETKLLSRFADWKKEATRLQLSNDALWVLVPYEVVDDSNREIPPHIIGQYLRSELKIPSIGIISIHTRIGLLAGINVEGKSLGEQSGEQISRFFSGEHIERIEPETVRSLSLEINVNEAKRLKLDIPPDLLGFAQLVQETK